MSRSWTELHLRPDHLYISLEPESVAACRVRGLFQHKLISKTLVECDPLYGPSPWEGALEALKKFLAPLKKERLEITVVLSNRLVRYALVPFDAVVAGAEEQLALARFHFTRIYGERAKSWDLRVGEGASGQPRIASGIDDGLVKALRACFPSGSRARLVSVQPYLMAAFNLWRRGLEKKFSKDGAWLVLLERSRACFALASREGWHSVQSLRLEAAGDVLVLLEREGLRSARPMVRRAMIHGKRPETSPGWQLSQLTLPRLQGYSPLDDGRYAMALCAL